MTRIRSVGLWLAEWFRRSGSYLAIGMVAAWLIVNIGAGPGVTVFDQQEAEGPQFSDVNTLDVVSEVRRNRVCPSRTQRWVWRWIDYNGKRAQQAVPLAATELPFLAQDGTFVLTLSSRDVPDADKGGWFFRSVTAETCAFMPTWISGVFGSRMFRSRDLPVNFIGSPHPK